MGIEQRRRPSQRELFCACGTAAPVWSGLCRRCYGARLRSRYRFGGEREAVLDRDRHRCRVCGGGERLAVHHRQPGVHSRDLLITLCVRCHARLHRLAALRRWVPRPLAELWPEVHPGVAVQLQFPLEEVL